MSSEIAEAVAAMMAEAAKAREARHVERVKVAALRQEHTRRRVFGLRRRHAAKLARAQQRLV